MDIMFDLALVVVIVAESIVDLSEREAVDIGDLFRISARLKLQDNMSHASTRALDDGFSPING